MSAEVNIQVENLGKRYHLGSSMPYGRLSEDLSRLMSWPFRKLLGRGSVGPQAVRTTAADRELWALKDVSFDVRRGEVIGVIGRNGAGKSTLLKLLSRITEPTTGRAVIHGRVGSLLEVGTGFHPELTGRENIFLNGAILGMRRAEIRRKFDEIVQFAEVERFLDTPVKRYSSGMYTRLAFAVAAHLEPEILLIDEVLAVGDSGFQRKCLGKMDDVSRSGRTIFFVSHNMAAISSLCTRSLLIESGRLTAIGPTSDVQQAYRRSLLETVDTSLAERSDRSGSGAIRFTQLKISTPNSLAESNTLTSGDAARLELSCETIDGRPAHNVSVALIFSDIHLNKLFTCYTRFLNTDFEAVSSGSRLYCELPSVPLGPGRYVVSVWSAVNGQAADAIDYAAEVTVADGDFFKSGRVPNAGKHGCFLVEHTWHAESEPFSRKVA